VPWEEFNINEFVEDKSSKNRSSIVVYIEASGSGKTAIFSGDSVPSEILQYIPFPKSVDLFKIPHHGSKSNTSKILVERVRAKHYIIPAGRESKKPHKKMLHTLLSNNNREYKLYLPEWNWSIQEIPQYSESKSCKVIDYSIGYKISL
jgi:beta-lactamase superfamily II metal-dependent hydrolase